MPILADTGIELSGGPEIFEVTTSSSARRAKLDLSAGEALA
jgi:hypothetical protein